MDEASVQRLVSQAQAAVASNPNRAAPRLALAVALWRAGSAEGSIEEIRQAIELEPANLLARQTLLDCLLFFHRHEEVPAASRDLLALQPGNPSALLATAQALHALGLYDELDLHLTAWLKRELRSYAALVFRGNLALEVGDFEAARQAFSNAVDAEPGRGSAYFGLVQCGSDWGPDDPAVREMLRLAQSGSLPPQERYQVHLALGITFENLELYERSMSHYDQANRIVLDLHNATRPFKIESVLARVARAEQITPDTLQRYKGKGEASPLPILVIGMMRSGTTLTEQVLASHPEVAGAGEQFFWSQRSAMNLESADLAGTARDYLDQLRRYGSAAKRVVDKMPDNFFTAGLIHIHLPNAKFVHVQRHPVDTCVSTWSTYYETPPGFTGSRANIVAMYRQYERVIAHWREVLPPDRLLEIRYEDLVRDQELHNTEVTRLLRSGLVGRLPASRAAEGPGLYLDPGPGQKADRFIAGRTVAQV